MAEEQKKQKDASAESLRAACEELDTAVALLIQQFTDKTGVKPFYTTIQVSPRSGTARNVTVFSGGVVALLDGDYFQTRI